MAIHAIHHHNGTFDHRCEVCGTVREGLRIDPAHGHVSVRYDEEGDPSTVATAPCPTCLATRASAKGKPLAVTESFRLAIPDHEVGEGAGESPGHPGSLVGMRFADTGGVVTEHTHGYSLDEATVAHKRLVRALERHPHLAPHLSRRAPPAASQE